MSFKKWSIPLILVNYQDVILNRPVARQGTGGSEIASRVKTTFQRERYTVLKCIKAIVVFDLLGRRKIVRGLASLPNPLATGLILLSLSR